MVSLSDHTCSTSYPLIRSVGDSAVTVEFGDRLETSFNTAAIAFDGFLRTQAIEGVTETAPTNRSVLVRFDPLILSPTRLRQILQDFLAGRNWYESALPPGRSLWRIPVKYGGDEGPDLEDTARALGVGVEEVAKLHSEVRLRVNMIGFSPGLAYCGALPDQWDIARLDHVKPQEPAGSICVAVRQTVIFPIAMPTGWRRIGRTPFRNFDLSRDPVFLIEPGDELQFVAIEAEMYQDLTERQSRGEEIVTREVLS